MPASLTRTWDVFCRVIDNWGDIGVCWRLAADLAGRGDAVRLWVDDASPLNFMAPAGAPGVTWRPWPAVDDALDGVEPADVVVEAFGCDLPPAFIRRMCQRPQAPVWINLEYLGVDDFARRSHGLPSPQVNGLPKWFFYPGLADGTGGLLREPGLLEARAAFDRDRWLFDRGLRRLPNERVVFLFCYTNPGLPAFLKALSDQPTLLLLASGAAQQQVLALQSHGQLPARLRPHAVPSLTQSEFDRALWSADLNAVRGEDSVVRALWAGAPILWQLYPQDAAVRAEKLGSWLQHFFPSGGGSAVPPDALFTTWLTAHAQYNGLVELAPGDALRLDDWAGWGHRVRALRERLAGQADLCTRLQSFVAGKS